MIQRIDAGSSAVTLTIEKDDELLARIQKRIRRRNEATADNSPGQRLEDAALAYVIEAAKNTWPSEELTMPQTLTYGEEETKAVHKILSGRHIDKPEDITYYVNAETLAELSAM